MVMPAQPPETVQAYLRELRAALKGAPAGLIADALADCEDHLNNEIAQNPDLTEKQILAGVVETYGTPEEIAEEYRDMEIATVQTPFPQPEQREERRFGFFNVVSDPRTYSALLYMLLSLATGIFYFTWTITGIALTAGLAILIIGVPFFLLFIASVRVLSHVEGRIVEALLGVRMPRRLPAGPAADEGLGTKIREAFTDLRTWSSMFYMLLMLPLGVTYFVVGVVGLSLSLGVTASCVYSLFTGESHFQISDAPYLQHFLHTAPGLIVFALLGILLFFVVLHVARAIGWVHGKIAEGLLVRL
ncbi:MAG: sensor domain-containing protein [Alphaproteobacteria bacterium]|nr:sensor domain-containing protein [Alphaproteobacteria bacterium]MBL6936426.1 sensor domain-containing protein [Alphaproteobacteria bacterium]MBL7098523.1 sensor domain-containing protein [Alphaproteobacteria bacterium]